MSLTDRILLRIDAESAQARAELRDTRKSVEQLGKSADRTGSQFRDSSGRLREANGRYSKSAQDAEKSTKGLRTEQSRLVKGAQFAIGAIGSYGVAQALGLMISENQEARKVAAQTNAVLKSTGGVAKVTSRDVDRLATSISKKAAIDDEAVANAENVLLTFTKVRNETGKGNKVFNQATLAATDMSAALGQDLQSSAIQVGKALNDPIKGVTALQRVGVSFTKSQKEQIKALVESGDVLGAQKLILKEINTEFGGAAAAKATPLEHLQVSALNLAETLGTDLAPAIDTGAKAATEFIDGMQDGTGAGGKFADALGEVVDGAEDVVHAVTPAAKWVAKITEEHPEILKVAGGFLAVSAAVKGITFASRISGLSAFLGAATKGAKLFKGLWATAGTDAGTAAARNTAEGLADQLPTSVRGRRDRIRGAGRIFGGIFAAGAAVVILEEVGDALDDALNISDKARKAANEWNQGPQGGGIFDFLKNPKKYLEDKLRDGLGDGWGARPKAFTGDGPGATARTAAVSLMGAKPALGHYASVAASYGLHVSDGKRPAGTRTNNGGISFHGSGDALDIADGVRGPSPAKMRFAQAMASRYGSQLEELIYTPLGYSIKNGRKVPAYATADHYDHVHVADTSPATTSPGGAGGSGGGWRDGTCTWYKPSAGGINGREGAGAWPGNPIYDSTWGCAAPPEFAFGTKIEFQYRGRSILVPVMDRGGAIKGTHFDLLPGPAAKLGMMSAGNVAVKFRVRGRDTKIVTAAAVKAAKAKAAKHQRSLIKKAAGVRRSVNASRGDRIEDGFEQRYTLALLTPSTADDARMAQQGLDYWNGKVAQYRYGVLHGDKRITTAMLQDAVSTRDTWKERVTGAAPSPKAFQESLDETLRPLLGSYLTATLDTPSDFTDDRTFATRIVEVLQRSYDSVKAGLPGYADQAQGYEDLQYVGGLLGNWRATLKELTDTKSPDEQDTADQQARIAETLRQNNLVLGQQLEAFKGFAPLAGMRYVGSFARGIAHVPHDGLAVLHRDEMVVPDPQGPFGSTVGVAAPGPSIELHLHGDAAALMSQVRAVVDGRAAQVTSQQLGRRQRVLSIAPGSRRI